MMAPNDNDGVVVVVVVVVVLQRYVSPSCRPRPVGSFDKAQRRRHRVSLCLGRPSRTTSEAPL